MSKSPLLCVALLAFAPALFAGGTLVDVGGGLAGTSGTPVLSGSGTLVGGSEVGLSLTGALGSASAWMIIGLSELNAPFKGGTLVPAADVVVSGLVTSPAGEISFAGDWPFGIPFGTEIWFQYWIDDGAGPVGFAASNGLKATTPSAPVLGTFPADWIHGGDCINDPAIQVHAYNDSMYILRQSMCTNFEGPFMFLLFGGSRALLLDSGAGGIPIAATVNGLIAQYEADHGVDVNLTVAHTHSHFDHTQGDSQFAGQPGTTVIGKSDAAVQSYFGFQDWPNDQVVLDLGGGRKLDVLAIPGHQAQSIAMYDRETGVLLTGDSLYPGFLFIAGATSQGNWAIAADSIDRLRTFADTVPVTYVLGTHVEMTSTAGIAYPYGTNNQPLERDPQLDLGHLQELDDAFEALGGTPQQDVHDDFIIDPSG